MSRTQRQMIQSQRIQNPLRMRRDWGCCMQREGVTRRVKERQERRSNVSMSEWIISHHMY